MPEDPDHGRSKRRSLITRYSTFLSYSSDEDRRWTPTGLSKLLTTIDLCGDAGYALAMSSSRRGRPPTDDDFGQGRGRGRESWPLLAL